MCEREREKEREREREKEGEREKEREKNIFRGIRSAPCASVVRRYAKYLWTRPMFAHVIKVCWK